MQRQIFLKGGPKVAVKALNMAVVFGECGRECLSRPGNTVGFARVRIKFHPTFRGA
jgi:hypothetical protein